RIETSWLQKVPGASSRYRALLPLFPSAVRGLKPLGEFVFSTDASVVKGISLSPTAIHVCYCHSPPRYLWDMQETYLQQARGIGSIGRLLFRAVTPYVRRFDYQAAQRVTHFIANS